MGNPRAGLAKRPRYATLGKEAALASRATASMPLIAALCRQLGSRVSVRSMLRHKRRAFYDRRDGMVIEDGLPYMAGKVGWSCPHECSRYLTGGKAKGDDHGDWTAQAPAVSHERRWLSRQSAEGQEHCRGHADR